MLVFPSCRRGSDPFSDSQLVQRHERESQGRNLKHRVTENLARASPATQLMEQIEDGALGVEKSSQKNNTLNVCCAEID